MKMMANMTTGGQASEFVTAAVLGAGFLYFVTRLWGLAQNGEVGGRDAMRVFGFSITYLTVLFVAMAADILISNHVHIH